jgi:hypothetical protein
MRARMVLGSLSFVLLGFGVAFSQALAEGALLHSGSAAATAKAGTTLGNALSKATSNLGHQIETVTETGATRSTIQQVPETPSRSRAAAASKPGASSGGFQITSIQGAHRVANADTRPRSSPTAAVPASDANGNSPPAPQKSVINLKFPSE